MIAGYHIANPRLRIANFFEHVKQLVIFKLTLFQAIIGLKLSRIAAGIKHV
jgi:hypothetical protein